MNIVKFHYYGHKRAALDSILMHVNWVHILLSRFCDSFQYTLIFLKCFLPFVLSSCNSVHLKCLAFNPLNTELNQVCHLLALLGAHHILHVSRVRVKLVAFVTSLLCDQEYNPFSLLHFFCQQCSCICHQSVMWSRVQSIFSASFLLSAM